MKPKYKKMLRGMREKERQKKKPLKEPWFLYILRCRDDTFYTGVTKDIARRLNMHKQGKASKYTRARRPLTLVYQERCSSRTQALVRECAVKALSRPQKEKLVLSV